MPRPKTISDADLLKVARRCFIEHGHTASTREIARAAGISQAVLYQRFGGKDAMFERAMTPEPPDLERLLMPSGPTDRATVFGIFERCIAHIATTVPATMRLMTHPNFDASKMGGMHETQLHAHALHAALAERLAALNLVPHPPEAMAGALIGLAHTLALQAAISGHKVDTGVTTALFEVVWTGLGVQEAG